MTELRRALRTFTTQPAVSLLIVVTLALGTGANTAIFSAVNSLILRDPPFERPDRLLRIATVRGGEGGGPVSVPELEDILGLPMIAAAALYTDQGMYNASGFGTPEELQATIATHDLFSVLGVPLAIGTSYPAEFDRTRNFGLVISHGLWSRKFAQDPAIVGRSVTLDGSGGYTIYGVLPEGFVFPSHSDIYRSSGLSANPMYYARRDVRNRYVVARLHDGVTVEQVQSALDALAQRLANEFPSTNLGLRFQATTLRDLYTANLRSYAVLLSGAVLLVLLVACANVGNLLLARAIARDRDIAIHVALGATRGRIVRQLVTESTLLAAAGGALGGIMALAGVQGIQRLIPIALPPWMDLRVDWQTGVFLAVVVLGAGLIAGFVPAWRSANPHLQRALNEGARGSSGGPGYQRLRNGLVIAQVAAALALLVGAGLLLQTVWRLHQVDLGVDTSQALTFRVELGWSTYGTEDKTTPFHDRALEQLRDLPGVRAATFDTNLPMSGRPRDPVAIRAFGQPRDDQGANPYVHLHQVGPDYFATMGIDIVRGRPFDTRDRPDSLPAAVVSNLLAERLWPGRDAVGQRLQLSDTDAPETWLNVVGVATPTLHHELDGAPGLDVYLPYRQTRTSGPYYVIRTTGDPWALAAPATAVIGRLDANQSFFDVQTYERRVANRIWQRHVAGALFMAFAVLTLVLGVVGLYGVLSYIVAQQMRDIGVRVALGATARDVVLLVMRRGLALAAAGVALGLVIALVLTRTMASLLFEVAPTDVPTFALASAALLLTAGVAAYVPARRALRIDPIEVLRAGR